MTDLYRHDEATRLGCLRGYGVLDTPPEVGCDRITALAARLFKVPAASISLVDESRQWLKSIYGPLGREAPRSVSFCARSVETGQGFVVRDASLDPEFAQNPLVLAPGGIRFYAGSPLRSPEGFILGNFCLISFEPRDFSAAEMTALDDFAAIATHELLLRKTTVVLQQEVAERLHAEEILTRQHGILKRLRGSLVKRVKARTADLTRANAELRLVEARYQRIASNTPGMVYQFRLRPDGYFDFPFVSEGCREIYGVEAQYFQEHPEIVMEIVHPEDRATVFPTILASAESLTPFHWTGRYVMPNGDVKWMQSNSRPERLANGDVLWDGIIFDITPLKEIQMAHRAAKEEAERANAAKSEFLSRMSHELRTPLNAILGFGQVLQMQNLTKIQRECLEHISKAGRHLLGLIDEVLDLARIESGNTEVKVESLDLRTVLREVLQLIRPLAVNRHIRLRLGSLGACPRVFADRQRINQILINLLANAVKYNVERGQINLTCKMMAGKQVRVAVADTGLGISSEKLSRLFTPFDRLGADQLGIEGSGLGLALTKRLVESMGGSIGVESCVGKGSTFWVQFPRDPAPARCAPTKTRARKKRAAPRQSVTRKVILYVEDNDSNLSLIEHLLAGYPNFSLLTAKNGAAGLTLASRRRPDLILLDLHLPDLSGEEVLVRLQADPLTQKIPAVILSADATPDTIARVMRNGASDYLTKPLDLTNLLGVLPKFLNGTADAAHSSSP